MVSKPNIQVYRKMKTKAIIVIQIAFFLILTLAAKAQDKPVLEKALTFTSVKNGFVYDLQLSEKINFPFAIGISIAVTNTGDNIFRLEASVNDDPWQNSCIYLEPGEFKLLKIITVKQRENVSAIFPAMNGLPGGAMKSTKDDPGIRKFTFKAFSKKDATFTISEIRPYGQYISPVKISESPGFFPFVDILGQYKHSDWPGKTKNESEMVSAIVTEANDLKLMPGPSGRDRFGGWADGPKLKATGYFRTEKVEGKWWLVDPDGCLYWSHGITCIDFTGANTRVSGRTRFFENLPGANDPLSTFYSTGRRDTTFNFTRANLYRKYGQQWKEKATENTLKRLKSWGINSFGNWSDPEIYLSTENRIPYTVGISSGRFPNVFDPAFREAIKRSFSRLDPRIKDDPYCIGFYIDNELNVNQITRRLISQSGITKSGLPFLQYIKNKYTLVEKLNNTWKTSYSNWQQVDTITRLPEGAKGDIKLFDLKILDLYYKICREEQKNYAPHKIYFGSRLHCHFFPDDQSEIDIIKVNAQYSDVVCFNRYRFSAEDLILPFNIDKPTLIGEFHWGALDRGLFHVGMRGVADQNQRADAYYHYVEGSLNNPQIVGTHWFQYGDQAATGRGDGENYQIGFVDVCDNPNPEIVAAARKIGYQMYKIRYGK